MAGLFDILQQIYYATHPMFTAHAQWRRNIYTHFDRYKQGGILDATMLYHA